MCERTHASQFCGGMVYLSPSTAPSSAQAGERWQSGKIVQVLVSRVGLISRRIHVLYGNSARLRKAAALT